MTMGRITKAALAGLALLLGTGCAPNLGPRAKTIQPDGGPSQQWTNPPNNAAPAAGTDGGAAAPAAPAAKTDAGTAAPAAAGTKTCVQIAECYDTCAETNQSCFDGCFNQGTPQAQSQMDALEQCDYQASQSTCKTQCAAEGQSCWDCLDKACAAQVTACFGA